MSKKEDNKKKKENLEDEFDRIQNQHSNINVQDYLVNPDTDLPEFGKLEIYDYDSDMDIVSDLSEEVIDNLVDLYLGDNEDIIKHPYIKQKKAQDKEDYADARFLGKMAKKMLLQNLKQIDNGDNGARMYEVATKLMSEIREINKDSRSSRTEIEKYYKDLRADMGLNDMGSDKVDVSESEEETHIINTKDLTAKIDEYLKGKK